MTYSYIRISTDKQTTKNQSFEINSYARKNKICIDRVIEETASSRKQLSNRRLGVLLKKLNSGDMIIVAEISRLGRNLMQIMGILNLCMEQKVKIIAIKENYELGDNINSKVLAFAFGLSAEIERNLISQRTKEALARKKAEGISLGRPKGSKAKKLKLTGKEDYIRNAIDMHITRRRISKSLNVTPETLNRFILSNISRDYSIRRNVDISV